MPLEFPTSPSPNEQYTYNSITWRWNNTSKSWEKVVNIVSSFNGLTGAVQGVSAAVAGTGIAVSGATGTVTITNIGVQSIGGRTGAITYIDGGSI